MSSSGANKNCKMESPTFPCGFPTPIGGDSLSCLQSFRKCPARARRRRKRPVSGSRRNNSISCLLIALAALALASSSWKDGSLVALASSDEIIRKSNDNSFVGANEEDDETQQTERKPYRPKYGGRIKLVPNRKIIRITTIAEESNTTPWNKKNKHRGSESEIENLTSPKLSVSSTNAHPSPTLWTRLSPFLKRGCLLAALTAVAILDRTPLPPTKVALLSSEGATTAASQSIAVSSWTANRLIPSTSLRLDWNKLWGLPGEILPSLSAALMIAWVPNLVLQKAWGELGFLIFSLSSHSNLRTYLLSEVLPSLGGTARKLFWSEFWKHAWDYLLEPFPHNILVPPKPLSSSSSSSSQTNETWSKWQLEVSRFWSDRVVSRIDKWTASSVKALLQKNVQVSVNGLAEDSWKSVSYAWYPGGENRDSKVFAKQLPSVPSNEDTARMIELECDDGSDSENCNDETEANQERTTTMSEVLVDENEVERSGTGTESSVVDFDKKDDEASTDSSPPSTLEVFTEVSSSCEEPQTIVEEPQAIRSSN